MGEENARLGNATGSIGHDGLYVWIVLCAQEHRSLSVNQLKVVEPADGVPHLIYTKKPQKNNPGGL